MQRKTSHQSINLLKVFAVLIFLLTLWTASSALSKSQESSDPQTPTASQEIAEINFEKEVFNPLVNYVENNKLSGHSLEYDLVLDRATEDPEYLKRLLETSSSTEKMNEATSIEAQVGKDLKKIWEDFESQKASEQEKSAGRQFRPGKLMLGGTSSGGGVK
ncbi:MAG: hypothetical protein LW875_06325 [Proteobacteria bacterium]|jgi:hypothetical protein|nr:hypothetical protein [Pseudomonadota bacterium]